MVTHRKSFGRSVSQSVSRYSPIIHHACDWNMSCEETRSIERATSIGSNTLRSMHACLHPREDWRLLAHSGEENRPPVRALANVACKQATARRRLLWWAGWLSPFPSLARSLSPTRTRGFLLVWPRPYIYVPFGLTHCAAGCLRRRRRIGIATTTGGRRRRCCVVVLLLLSFGNKSSSRSSFCCCCWWWWWCAPPSS